MLALHRIPKEDASSTYLRTRDPLGVMSLINSLSPDEAQRYDQQRHKVGINGMSHVNGRRLFIKWSTFSCFLSFFFLSSFPHAFHLL